MADFAFYSTDISATADPANADPAPATLVVLDQPPVFGEYEEPGGSRVRGSVIPTLGGVQVQDFGAYVADGRIRIAEQNAIYEATVAALHTIHQASGTEYFFTDGFDVWRVKFSRPTGFMAWKNLFWKHHGIAVYSYEINLVVLEKAI